jgi:succinate dehydrogenase / fumarate reductase membrane anchor subunit
MKLATHLHRAQGLGSAKRGLHHWIVQRVTAVALIPLSVWFVSVFMILLRASHAEVHQWLSSPLMVTFSILLILSLFYHGYLGIHVILEDYMTHDLTKWIFIITTKFFSVTMALLAILSLLKIFLR